VKMVPVLSFVWYLFSDPARTKEGEPWRFRARWLFFRNALAARGIYLRQLKSKRLAGISYASEVQTIALTTGAFAEWLREWCGKAGLGVATVCVEDDFKGGYGLSIGSAGFLGPALQVWQTEIAEKLKAGMQTGVVKGAG